MLYAALDSFCLTQLLDAILVNDMLCDMSEPISDVVDDSDSFSTVFSMVRNVDISTDKQAVDH